MYIGRFAPSPSGPLHLGSLVAALASYLDAKANNGKWLVRIEDIDKPREMPGASQLILDTLAAFALHWDEEVVYQSQRSQSYLNVLEKWLSTQTAYACNCTRKRLKTLNGIYDGHCTNRQLTQHGNAIRFANQSPYTEFDDVYLGQTFAEPQVASSDFIIHRRDGLFAYQLAVVIDDAEQQVTQVVRGQDLLETTVWQMALFNALGAKQPRFAHVPVVLAPDGRKLSKQNGAPALDIKQANQQLYQALVFLKQQPPQELQTERCENILSWAVNHWQPHRFVTFSR